ncbi:MAG: hypothetical protein ACOY33_05080 [Pseudomonadota bacterium]
MSAFEQPPHDPLKKHTTVSILGVILFVVLVIVSVGLSLYAPLG